MKLPKLYFILDINLCLKYSIKPEDICQNVLHSGVRLIQLRAKGASDQYLDLSKTLRKLTSRYSAFFIINDHIGLVDASCADGLHIGQEDISAEEARHILPKAIIGVSVHNIKEAIKAEKDGADYLGAGPAFPTNTKQTSPISFSQLNNTISATPLPSYLIGGINPQNISQLNELNYYGVAVASSITENINHEQTIKKFNQVLQP